jgi:integrase
MQRGSLKKFHDARKRVWVWRFQWREPGFKGPRTRELGRCSEVTRADARAKADEILRRVQGSAPQRQTSTLTLTQFLENEYLDVKTRKWKASTRGTTEQIIEDHILAPIGGWQLHTITRKTLQTLLDNLAANGKSRSVVDHVRWQLRAIFEMALGDGVIDVDPTSGLQTPRCKPQPEKRWVEHEDEIRRAEMSLELRERLIFRLAVVYGLRPGEIVGLKCRDVTGGRLSIERRVYRRVVDSPKSERSRRELPNGEEDDPRTAAMLEEYLGVIQDSSPDAWLFASENPAKPLDYSNVFRRRIRPALQKAGLGWVNFQVLRRTYANKLAETENDAKVRADMMGHSTDTQNNQYRFSPMDRKRQAQRGWSAKVQ